MVVNNSTADAANPAQAELNKENTDKGDGIPNTFLKPEEAADENCTVKCCGAELIGCRVKIWWPQERTFVRGKIKYFNSDEGLHIVDYDLGVKEVLDLSEERWHLEQETDSGPGASNTMVENAGISSSSNSKRKHAEAGCKELMTRKSKKENAIEKELNLHEDQPISPKTAAADSKIISQSSEHQKRQKTLASSFQEGNADNNFADVGGYLVKASIAPTLRSIFSKCGDIASNCLFKHHSTRSIFLEIVCNIINKLRHAENSVSTSEVQEMICQISDVAEAKLDVSWLQKFLKEIYQEVGKNSFELMELRVNSNMIVKAAKKDMEYRRMEAITANEKFMEAKNRWKALEYVKEKIENDVVESLAPKQAWRSTVDELL